MHEVTPPDFQIEDFQERRFTERQRPVRLSKYFALFLRAFIYAYNRLELLSTNETRPTWKNRKFPFAKQGDFHTLYVNEFARCIGKIL